jgi:DNA repair exonuclease SbcCD ATPase subunit
MSIRIEASNFRCYENLDVTIPDSGLILVDGVNVDEGGSSNSSGKCFARGTRVLMFNGLTRNVEDIIPGDLLMGPDSKPRTVRTLARGREMMYKVSQQRGEPYIVNESHTLALKYCSARGSRVKKGDALNISVKDYLSFPKDNKRLLVGYKTDRLDFSSPVPLKIDPYWFGVWLGDGGSESSSITSADPEIASACEEEANRRNLRLLVHGKKGSKAKTYMITSRNRGDNTLFEDMMRYGLVGNKHIPHQYRTASFNDRAALLAGLIDSDGYYYRSSDADGGLNKTSRNSYEFVNKNKDIADGVCFLARSLGLSVTATLRTKSVVYKHRRVFGDYWIIFISGAITRIPCRIKRKKPIEDSKRDGLSSGIKVEPVGEDDYFGFSIDGPDRLFLLDDFTVVHNSSMLDSLAWARYGWLPRWEGPKGGSADAVIRRGNKSCWVRVTEGGLMYERRRPSKLKIWKDGTEQPSWGQAELEREIGQSPQRFLVGSYLAQRRARQSFWAMGEQERMKLISVAAGQESSSRAFLIAKAKRDAAQLAVSKNEGGISALQSQISMLPNVLAIDDEIAGLEAHLAPTLAVVFEMNQSLALCIEASETEKKFQEGFHTNEYANAAIALEKAFGGEREVLDAKVEGLASQINSVEKKVAAATVIIPMSTELATAETMLKDAEAENIRITRQHQEADFIARSNERIVEEIGRHLDAAEKSLVGACPTCCRDLPEADRSAASAKHVSLAEQAQVKIKDVPAKLDLINVAAIQDLVWTLRRADATRLAEAQAAPRALFLEKAALEAQLRETQAAIRHLVDNLHRADADAMRKRDVAIKASVDEQARRVAEVTRILKDAETKAADLSKGVVAARERLRQAAEMSARLNSSLVDMTRALETARSQLDEVLDLMEVFSPSGWPSIEFEGLVQRISDSASDIVSKVSRGIYSTRLEQAAEDSQGNQKTVLKAVVLKGGAEVPLDDPSGAKEAIFELAYDIAISGISGGTMPLLVDEAMEGLDVSAKEGAMEMLSEIAQGRAILVIDHSSEHKAMYQNVWKVTKTNDVSSVEQ